MEDKYYRPTRDEFYLGFEYQGHRSIFLPSSKEEWLNLEFGRWTDPSSEDNFKEALYNGGMRVKYLDQSDIESLGFKDDSYDKIQSYSLELAGNKLGYTVTIVKWDDNKYSIYHYHPDGTKSTIFFGTIKNLNELRRILRMLDID